MSWTGDNRTAINEARRELSLYGGNGKAAKVVSAYYSGATTKYSLWRQAWWRLDHLWWAFWWSRQAIYYAVDLLDFEILQAKAGLRNPLADEVDVLCTVLRRFKGKKYDVKLQILLRHLETYPDSTAESFSQAFVLMHRVRMGIEPLDEATEVCINYLADATRVQALSAEYAGDQSEAQRLFGQAARIYRQLANLLPVRRVKYLTKATEMARAGGVTDQLLKLSAS